MIPRTLAIIFTYKCNFFCKHCSMRASPSDSTVIDLSLFKKAVDDAEEIPSIYTIAISGGEPTLFLNRLLQAVRYAYYKGFNVRVVTNAWWASTIEQSRKLVSMLKNAGLNELNVSYDDFHKPWLEKYGGERNIVNAVRAAVEEGLRVAIAVVRYSENDIINRSYIINLLKKNNIISENITIIEDYVYRFGRGVSIEPDIDKKHYNKQILRLKMPCNEIGTTLAIHPDGTVMACCGHIIRDKAARIVTIGNLTREPLLDIIKRMWRNPFYWWLSIKGPHAVLDELLKVDVESLIKKYRIYSRCELCRLIGTKYEKQVINIFSEKLEDIVKILNIAKLKT